MSQPTQPSEEMLHALFRAQLDKEPRLKQHLSTYDYDVKFNGKAPSYVQLTRFVEIDLEQRRYNKHKNDLMHKGQPGTAYAVSDRDCRAWMNKGACNRGDECPYEHRDEAKGKGKSKGKGRGKGKSKGKGKGKGKDKARGRSSSADTPRKSKRQR